MLCCLQMDSFTISIVEKAIFYDGHLDDCVEEDQGDDKPEHELGLADVSDSAPVLSIPPKKRKHQKNIFET